MNASRLGSTKFWAASHCNAASMSAARFSASAWLGQLRPHTSVRPREEKLSTTRAT